MFLMLLQLVWFADRGTDVTASVLMPEVLESEEKEAAPILPDFLWLRVVHFLTPVPRTAATAEMLLQDLRKDKTNGTKRFAIFTVEVPIQVMYIRETP